MDLLVELKDICKSYGQTRVLNNISLRVNRGDMISVMGRSGAGKSTLLNVLGLLDTPDSGCYSFKNEQVNFKNDRRTSDMRLKNIGFVIQNYALIAEKTIFDNIALPLRCLKFSQAEIRRQVEHAAGQMGIEEQLKKYPYQLSGGENQRAAIARAVIRRPELLLADEPTGALDSGNEERIMAFIKGLNADGLTVVLVTHNEALARQCERIYYISDGSFV